MGGESMKLNMIGKKRLSLEEKEGRIGAMFMLPWLIGFVVFFAIPMVTSLIYSFNKVSFGNEGIVLEFVGFNNYIELFTSNKKFWEAFTSVVSTLLYEVPVVVLFSLFISLLLNMNIPGRLIFRSVFFLPIVFMADTIYKIISVSGVSPSVASAGNALMTFDFGAQGIFTEMLEALGLGEEFLSTFSRIINNIFQISWKAPIQIILYLTGLQSIPDSYYEVCMIEGATKWESFWKVTFPMLSPITLLCLVYSIIDTFTDANSKMISLINSTVRTFMHESMSISWCYFIFVFVFVGIVLAVVSRWVKYMD